MKDLHCAICDKTFGARVKNSVLAPKRICYSCWAYYMDRFYRKTEKEKHELYDLIHAERALEKAIEEA